ncbi:MAG: cellobiose phosphorylase, partial [Chitinophagaceae bacterium]|nr:cellobiose phosphorylase [Anaerolineae bacterium]
MTTVQSEQVPPERTEQTGIAQDELEGLAKQLAKSQKAVRRSDGVKLPLLRYPERQEALLNSAQQHFAQSAEQELTLSYAGEWLLDNYYVVQQSLRQVIEDIPARFYDELPKLIGSPLEGFPRIYAIAREIADWSITPFTIEQIKTFINAYQESTPLTMGELWALPATLRAVNLENLIWNVGELIGVEEARSIFQGMNLQAQPADEMRVANAIINLRMLSAQDWRTYFEAVSRVEQALCQDPSGVYPRMDFMTRNRYRQIIESLAPETGQDEERVARATISLAKQAAAENLDPQDRTGHIGYYLMGAGRAHLEANIDYSPTRRDRFLRWRQKFPTLLYLGNMLLLTLAILLVVVAYVSVASGTAFQIVFALLVALLPASAIAVSMMNWLISRTVPPSILPKMDFSQGIPAECSTMVVVPALLSDIEEINSLGRQLELHFIRNDDPSLSFALLLDFPDASQQHMPGDEDLLKHARSCIQSLNERYGTSERRPFYFFLRERRWNASENTWMGWERKRGKLMELNRLLLDSTAETSYIVQEGDLNILPLIRYVITLDSDTVLPKDSAHRLVATMAHPLNRAQFDEYNNVVAGYTILQPRTEISPTNSNRTLFTRIFAGDAGFDLYTLAVSDVYQDWFGEGIYIGKGIYDVSAFDRSLDGQTPENAILSHDLFEGLHGRAALVTDVVLLEDYPQHYLIHTRRLHRWIRGDWQLLPWLLPRVLQAKGERAQKPLSMLDRWKILDNLRRSLLPPALLLLFVAGWLYLPGTPLFWTMFALLVSAMPLVIAILNLIADLIIGGPWEAIAPQFRINVLRWLLSLVFLPHESLLALSAITTTLHRLYTRQYLLQWMTTTRAMRLLKSEGALGFVIEQMFNSLILVLGVGILVALVNPVALWVSAPLLILWMVSPTIALWLNHPVTRSAQKLSDDQLAALRTLARRTWLFFEQFVGPEDHWLPPDHFQESPRGIIAHHTSPTNIGLMLLSTLAAYDLGYMGLLELSARLQLTFENLEKLERYRGHFLNWYDTRTLIPLPPRYVSTVDSGNLACCLLTFRQGLEDLSNAPIIRRQRWLGLQDTLAVLEETLSTLTGSELLPKVETLIARLKDIRLQVMAIEDDPVARILHVTELIAITWPEVTRRLVEILEVAADGVDVPQLGT